MKNSLLNTFLLISGLLGAPNAFAGMDSCIPACGRLYEPGFGKNPAYEEYQACLRECRGGASFGTVQNISTGLDVSMQIRCENGFSLLMNDVVSTDEKAFQTYAWVQQQQGQQFVYEAIQVHDGLGQRTVSVPNPYCSQTLTENGAAQWTLLQNCEGVARPPVSCLVVR